jgi:hypothetical protein
LCPENCNGHSSYGSSLIPSLPNDNRRFICLDRRRPALAGGNRRFVPRCSRTDVPFSAIAEHLTLSDHFATKYFNTDEQLDEFAAVVLGT